jgi:hypothetical protein
MQMVYKWLIMFTYAFSITGYLTISGAARVAAPTRAEMSDSCEVDVTLITPIFHR